MNRIPRIHQGCYGRVFVLNLDAPLVEHAHSDSHLIFAVKDDVNDIISVSGVKYELTKSQAIAVNRFEPHAHHKPNDKVSKCLVFYLNRNWLRDRKLFTKEVPEFNSTAVQVSNILDDIINELMSFLATDPKAIDLEPYVFQTVSSCLEVMGLKMRGISEISGLICDADPRVKKSVEYMQNHLGKRLRIDDVAKASGLSRPHLFSLFRKHLNLTPGVFWNTLRVEAAIDQLLYDEVALTDLANALGFSEPGNFSRFFRSHTGCSPGKYRVAAEF